MAITPLFAITPHAAVVENAAGVAARVLPQPAVDINGGSGSVSPEPVRPRAQATRRLVYSCTTASLVTFADRPCGLQPVLRELVVQPGIMAGGVTPTIGTSGNGSKRDRSPAGAANGGVPASQGKPDVADEATQHEAACRKMQSRLDQVDAQMRAGYTAAQAGRLWDRWREARQDLREHRC